MNTFLAPGAPPGPRLHAGKPLQAAASAQTLAAPHLAPPVAPPAPASAAPSAPSPLLPAFRAASLLAAHLRKLGALVHQHKQAEGAARRQGLHAVPGWWRAAAALRVEDSSGLQDVAAAMVLCEAVYRAVELGQDQAEVAIQRLSRQLPAAPRLGGVQWSPPQQEQRYVVADAGDALVVAFLGTKLPADHLVNLRLRHAPLFPKRPPAAPAGAESAGEGAGSAADESAGGDPEAAAELAAAAAAHSGYLRRAAGIPVEQLYQLARVQGKRLVLAGHSLGGAVAQLCALRLLDALPPALHDTLSCIGFAVPPVGNPQLAAMSQAYGWGRRLTNYTLEEDWVPGLLGLFAKQQAQALQGSSQQLGGEAGGAAGEQGAAQPEEDSAQQEGAPSGGPAHDQHSAVRFAGSGSAAQPAAPSQQQAPRRRRPNLLLSLVAAAVVAFTASVLGPAGGRLVAALAALPAHLLPRLEPIGRQVSLPRALGVAAQHAPSAPPPRQQAAAREHDPLVPMSCSGRLAAHRMITYRLRIAGLYA